jgi:glycerol kinase
MTGPLILAVDQGTTSTKALLVGEDGTVHNRVAVPVSRQFPRADWVEQDATEIWESVEAAIEGVVTTAPGQTGAIALTNQRESVVLWERHSGAPVGPCVGWQCRRGAPLCEHLRKEGADELVRAKTGLPLDASFSAPKASWLLDQSPELRERAEVGELCLGTLDSWLLWKLTAGASHRTDLSNASRTLLLNLHTLDWDDELLELFEIPRAVLPSLESSSSLHGEAVRLGPLASGVPVRVLIADSHAALLGQGCIRPGLAKATLGTGTSVMAPTSSCDSPLALTLTIAWAHRCKTQMALEGNIFSTGSTVQWVAELLGLAGAEEVEALAAHADESAAVYLVPAFVGLGAPYWSSEARGSITGLRFASGRAELARAAIESIAFQIRDVVDSVDSGGEGPVEQLRLDGGATSNEALVQLLADTLGREVARSDVQDAAAFGAAFLAGLEEGRWSALDDVTRLLRPPEIFEPRLPPAEREERYRGWREAVAGVRNATLLTVGAPV